MLFKRNGEPKSSLDIAPRLQFLNYGLILYGSAEVKIRSVSNRGLPSYAIKLRLMSALIYF